MLKQVVYNGRAGERSTADGITNQFGEKTIDTKDSHVLSNGYTYLAVTLGLSGEWAKATDPMTAIRRAADESGCSAKRPTLVQCIYGPSEELSVGEMGGIFFQSTTIAPVGLFTVTPKAIKATERGDINGRHQSMKEWIESTVDDIRMAGL